MYLNLLEFKEGSKSNNQIIQGAKKLVFFTLNTKILQFVQSTFLEFILHIFILVRCKIPWLDVQKKQFSKFLLFAIEMAILNVFFAKTSITSILVKA